jgi:hypothetical protein
MAITISGSGITSANIADGTITNGDIHPSAAISGSKLSGASLTNIPAANITGALPALDGSALTNLPASGFTGYGRRNFLSGGLNINHDGMATVSLNSTEYEANASGKILHDGGKWTITEAGYYSFTFKVYFLNAATSYHQTFIQNWAGGAYIAYSIREGTGNYETLRCQDTRWFPAGHEFKLTVKSNDTSYSLDHTNTYFTIWRVA